jgi:membrane-bound lytic murein transglycosylase D
MKIVHTLFFLLAAATATNAISPPDTLAPSCHNPMVLQDDPEMMEIDRILVNGYLNHYCFCTDQQVLNAYGYTPEQVPTFPADLIASRLKILDQDTPFDLVYNSTVQSFIDLYAVRRRDISSKVLGMSQLYFPMFEEYLAKYDIPLEMKYLAVVESALNPSVISHAGAGGLWQFMVATGKMYGLSVTSYQDERYDPFKATDAACRYLKSLYELYNDWELALAAYNSGPGNVNKAIRRSGGKKDFWAIKQYLPKETQGYVPAFIAVNYVMNFASEYNIYPIKPLITFFETDTVTVQHRLTFAALSKIISVPVEDLTLLNATYKLKEIPDNGQVHYLILPTNKIGLFLANEKEIYAQSLEKAYYDAGPVASTSTTPQGEPGTTKVVWEEGWKTHKVKSGESLGVIAAKNHVSVAELKKWNKIKGSMIHPGQKLKIKTQVKKTITIPAAPAEDTAQKTPETGTQAASDTAAATTQANNTTTTTVEVPKEDAGSKTVTGSSYKYYTVQKGDTLWGIANKHEGVTVNEIKSLNSNLRDKSLEVGQKIKIRQVGG